MDWLGFGGGGYRSPVETTPKSVPVPVVLHIYDVSGHSAVTGANRFFRAIGTGAYHAGVEVYGKEWSYGCSDGGYGGSGIFDCDPKGCGAHVYRESKDMGHTSLTKKEVKVLLDQLATEWLGERYDLLRHNCCHFCNDFTVRLGVGPCPQWLTNLAGVGAMLRSGVRLVAKGPNVVVGGVAAAGAAAGAAAAEAAHRSPVVDAHWPKVGDPVEIWSNSSGRWCPGRVDGREQDAISVTYRLGEAGVDGSCNSGTKKLPFGSKDLRPRASAGTVWQPRSQPREADRRSSAQAAQSPVSEQDALKVPVLEGDPCEVYSNSQKVWCPGYVERVRGNMLTLAYQVPNAEGYGGDWIRKTLPSEDKGWKKGKAQANGVMKAYASELAGALDAFNIGDNVEIFSNSNQVWCPGRVTKRRTDVATVCFQVPGAGPDDWLEKDIRLDSKDIRRANDLENPSGAVGAGGLGSPWTEMEQACYEREFIEMLCSGDASGTSSADAAAEVRQVVDLLARSGLPRRTLKEIWVVANPRNKEVIDRYEFFVCCRLVAQCQVLADDPAKTELLEEGGGKLRQLLESEFKHSVPYRLPDFYYKPVCDSVTAQHSQRSC